MRVWFILLQLLYYIGFKNDLPHDKFTPSIVL